jgi:hypothetical protein
VGEIRETSNKTKLFRKSGTVGCRNAFKIGRSSGLVPFILYHSVDSHSLFVTSVVDVSVFYSIRVK